MIILENLMDVIHAWKNIGETPLQTLKRIRFEYGISNKIKSCYAGRLDPMAQGVLTLLFNEAIYWAPEYNHCSKQYRFQAILGIGTDSYDALGNITNVLNITPEQALEYRDKMLALTGTWDQHLPPFSAYRYQGKKLWQHARNGTLPSILPKKNITVYDIEAGDCIEIPLIQHKKEVFSDISDMSSMGDFDIEKIINSWNNIESLSIWKLVFTVKVSSGTYVRSLVHDLGHILGVPAHAFRITRLCYYREIS